MQASLLHELALKARQTTIDTYFKSDNIGTRVLIDTRVSSVYDPFLVLAPASVHRPRPSNKWTLNICKGSLIFGNVGIQW